MLGDFGERRRREDRGGVDEDVDTAEGVEDARDHLLDFGDVFEVGAECLRPAPLRSDLGDDCVGFGVRVAIVDCDCRAVRGEVERDCAAEAAAGAGYQCDFVFEIHRARSGT